MNSGSPDVDKLINVVKVRCVREASKPNLQPQETLSPSVNLLMKIQARKYVRMAIAAK